jgi:hypothetical protein
MKVRILLITTFVALLLLVFKDINAQKSKVSATIDTLNYSLSNDRNSLEIRFTKGENFNHPTFAIWVEDLNGNYIESLFVTQYIATGVFGNADAGNGKWSDEPGESIRPAALPYWAHKRNVLSRDSIYVPTPENPVIDAITGATPTNSFIMTVPITFHSQNKFKVLFEINQSWDWNDYWTNSKYPNDKDYKTSSQPSVIYVAELDWNNPGTITNMKPIGHGHYSGNDGSLTDDLSTLTTALSIAKQIQIKLVD